MPTIAIGSTPSENCRSVPREPILGEVCRWDSFCVVLVLNLKNFVACSSQVSVDSQAKTQVCMST